MDYERHSVNATVYDNGSSVVFEKKLNQSCRKL